MEENRLVDNVCVTDERNGDYVRMSDRGIQLTSDKGKMKNIIDMFKERLYLELSPLMGCDRGKNDLGSDDVGVDDAGYFDLSHDDVGHDGGGYKKVDRDNKLVRYYDVQNLDRPKEQDDDYNEVAYDGADEFQQHRRRLHCLCK